MTSISDYLDRMVVTATSPDQCIHSRVSNYTEVEVWFRPRTFQRYREDELSYQLTRLAATTWVAYHRERSEAYRQSQGLSREELAEAERRPRDDSRRRAYEDALNEIEGIGVSTGGTVRIHTRGMLQWDVHVEPGAIDRLGEEGTLAEIHSAFKSWMNDREMEIITLKSEHYDLGIPRRWLDVMKELQAINARRR